MAAAKAARRHWQFYLGSVVYALLIGVALISPITCMLGHLLMALYYVSDRLPSQAEDGVADPA